jgi:chromosome segregation ATPase
MAGKTGITYSEVQAAADALVAEKQEPTIKSVRDRLRTGSPNTIHRHLRKWREARPEAPAATVDLPQSIIREINGEIQRAATAARAEVEAQLARALAEAAELSATGEALEAERDALTEQLAALTSERDVQAGKAAEQAAEIERLSLELERERKAAEDARIEVAQGRLAADALGKQLEELRADLARLRDESTQERQARIEAERNLAGAAAARDGLAARLADLQEREQLALREMADLRTRLERSQDAASTAHVEASELRGQVAVMRDVLKRTEVVPPGEPMHQSPARSDG